MIDDRTDNLSVLLPNAANDLSDDVLRIRSAIMAFDGLVFSILSMLASDDTSLDTLQEVVTALKATQTSLTVVDSSYDTLQKVVTALKAAEEAIAQDVLLDSDVGVAVQAYANNLASLAGLSASADTVPYFTGYGSAALATLTSAARTLLAAADPGAQRAALGVAIGTDVQAQNIGLSALGVLTSSADTVPYFTGYGSAALATLTSAARTLLAAADPGAQRAALGVVTGTYEIVDGASVDIYPDNGAIQSWALGANRTATANSFGESRSVTLMVEGGDYLLTWPSVAWVGSETAPSFEADRITVVELWKVAGVLYGALVGYI